MNWKTWVPLVLAIVLGLAAAKVAREQIMKTRLANGPAGKFVEVVVAKNNIDPGKELKAEDLNLAKLPENAVPEASFKTINDLIANGEKAGRIAEMAISKNQPI